MTNKSAFVIAIAIIIHAILYAGSHRYLAVPSPLANIIITKDTWTGTVKVCNYNNCQSSQSK